MRQVHNVVIGVVLACLIAAAVGRSAASAQEAVVVSLSDVVEKALARDLLVRDAQQSLENARAALVRARAHTPIMQAGSNTSASSSAGLDPQSAVSGTESSSQSYYSAVGLPFPGGVNLNLSSSAFTSTTNSSLRGGGGMAFTYAGASVGAGVSLPLPLFRNERVLTEGGRWEAERSLRSAEVTLEEARRAVVSAALTNFFAALQAQRQAEFAEASQQEAEELLRIAQEKFKLGKIAEIDVMEAQVGADSARTGLRSAQSAAANALDLLRNFLGIPLEENLRLSDEGAASLEPAPLKEAALLEQALARRADLRQLALRLQSAELSLRQAESRARPAVSLAGGYSRSGEGPNINESFRQLLNPSWYMGISTSVSLTGKADQADIEQARSSLRLAQTEEQLRKDDIWLEIRRLMREVENAAANAALLEATVKRAEENLSIRQVQFEHGLVRPIDVMQTERQLNETRNQRLNALIDYHLARARLSLAVGEMPLGTASGS